MSQTAETTLRSSGPVPASVPLGGWHSFAHHLRAPRHMLWLVLGLLLIAPRAALAGGGPENVLLVVNQNSWASQTIANHWRHWRSIPERNILSLDWQGNPWNTNIETFREEILQPVVQAISQRNLEGQIDYVIYADDFPYVVDFRSEAGDPDDKSAGGSLTGLTYLADPVLGHSGAFTDLHANNYYRRSLDPEGTNATHGFRHSYAWANSGDLLPAAGGRRYYLSTSLAYTSGRGTSVAQALRSLQRSALVDGLQPVGTVYYLDNDDIRSRTRQNQFAAAIAQLQAMGHAAERIEGRMPENKADVMGAMLGHFNFNWETSGSHILPGAICENLTSYGGIMRYNQHQPPLTELLAAGAAGASGTVVEPYATPAKFPHAGIQVHYARGCTLAESFYQSVAGPYQLLIVGDPLCRPWANIPQVELAEFEPGQAVSGVLELSPTATCGEQGIAELRLFVDGLLTSTVAPGEGFSLDTTELLDGYHELRIVAIEDSPIESQGRLIVPITVDNSGVALEWSLSPEREIPMDQRIIVTASAPGAGSIVVIHQGRAITTIAGDSGEIVIFARDLGMGPARLQAVAMSPGSGGPMAYSTPLDIIVTEPSLLPAQQGVRAATLTPGVLVNPQGAAARVAATTESKTWLSEAGATRGQPFVLTGYFRVEENGMAQFQANFSGQLTISVDGTTLLESTSQNQRHVFVPAALAAGWHEFTATATLDDLSEFRCAFGVEGAAPLSAAGFHCQP